MEDSILTTISFKINDQEIRSDNLISPLECKTFEEYKKRAFDDLERWFFEVKHFGFNEELPNEYEGVYVGDDDFEYDEE